MSLKRYDDNGNRFFNKFTGMPVQPWYYHIAMGIITLILLSPIIYLAIKDILSI